MNSGPRPAVPADDFRVLKAAARMEWEGLVAGRRRDRRFRLLSPALAAAAVVFVLAGVVWWRLGDLETGSPEVAQVELLRGNVWLEEPDDAASAGGDSLLAIGGPVAAGVELVTGQPGETGRNVLAVRLAGGQSVRLDSGSRARLLSPAKVQLLRGALYVDSAAAPETAAVEILTDFGSIVDIGTQFEVRLDGDGPLMVRVRSGSVSLRRRHASQTAQHGEELRLERDGSIVRSVWDPASADLDWILTATPPLDIEGLPLASFLSWVTRETGWRIQYEDEVLAGAVETIELHGTIEGLRPDEAVVVVLPGSGLGHRVEGGTLFIERLPPGDNGM